MRPDKLYLLDTNAVSIIVTGRSPVSRTRYLEISKNSRIAISAITEAEVNFGLAKNAHAIRAHRDFADFMTVTPSLPWDSAAASVYGSLRVKLSAAGLTLTSLDLLIAAHAVALQATLVTHDKALHRASDFLSVEDWATDL